MNPYLLILIKLSACFLALFAVAELLHRFAGVKAERTRKLVHIGTGLLTLLFPLYFDTSWQVAVICVAFLVILWTSARWGFLPSVNNIDRKSAGSLLYPVVVIVVFAFYEYMMACATLFNPLLYFYLPILSMAIGDPVAAIAGGGMQGGIVGRKTNRGTWGFFIVVSIVAFLLMLCFNNGDSSVGLLLLYALPLAAATAIIERVTGGGWDNFTIPVVACVYLWVLSKLLV